ncbi:GxxExxY protein [Hymenobacter sp. GOD-10R]|uniref:GxxExxY protein n=1 Tax=Hymenobacter sp. GOD-10R TaxID=3093922 RepID=UPI002D7934F1|nr:GxxExxY protein [Hymenobacter sp. GOD-10R]WRQ28715.1 GxxExxY protein [Hymenobacter sp. GOD-10R]
MLFSPQKAYDGLRLENGFRMDIVVEDKVIVELKSVEVLLEVHHMQLLTYLKLSGHKLGLLINFNVPAIKAGIFRKVNDL